MSIALLVVILILLGVICWLAYKSCYLNKLLQHQYILNRDIEDFKELIADLETAIDEYKDQIIDLEDSKRIVLTEFSSRLLSTHILQNQDIQDSLNISSIFSGNIQVIDELNALTYSYVKRYKSSYPNLEALTTSLKYDVVKLIKLNMEVYESFAEKMNKCVRVYASTNAGSKAVSYMLSEDALRYATPEFLIKDISRWLSEKLVKELRDDFKC